MLAVSEKVLTKGERNTLSTGVPARVVDGFPTPSRLRLPWVSVFSVASLRWETARLT